MARSAKMKANFQLMKEPKENGEAKVVLGYDTETTGLSWLDDRVVQIVLRLFNGQTYEVLDEFLPI